MPTYDYTCEECERGSFELYRSVDQRNLPAICPECGVACGRMFTMPSIKTLDPKVRNAIDRNIQSQHAPKEFDSSRGGSGSNVPPSHRRKKPKRAYGGPRSWVMESRESAI
ncbi:MAG: FmdB family zinc ribbon protein [Verrucomicrobiota bacterium]